MSPDGEPFGSVRPADVVNDQIRALFHRAGGRLYGEDRAEYERLIVEWIRAVAAERVRPEMAEAA